MREQSTSFVKNILAMRDYCGIICIVDRSEYYGILQGIAGYNVEKKMGIPDVARACGLSDSTVRSIIDRKAKNVTLEVAFKLQRGLNVSLARLNGIENGPASECEGRPANELDEQLINYTRGLTDDQKRFLIAQIKILKEPL